MNGHTTLAQQDEKKGGVYIVYGLSGPLKRLLIESIVSRYPKNIVKIMINKKGTTRPVKKYDRSFEIETLTKEDFEKKYEDSNYHYDNDGALCGVDKTSIQTAIEKKEPHFIICHDPKVIQQIVNDFKDQTEVILLRVFIRDFHEVLTYVQKEYGDSKTLVERKKKLEKLEKKIVDANIKYTQLVEPQLPTDSCSWEDAFWQKFQVYLDRRSQYNWPDLLSTERRSGTNSKENDQYAFEHDYKRVLNSSAFRRLQDKAQVFPLERYDYVRTRLTHSLETSSIAERLGIRVAEIIKKNAGDMPLCDKIPSLLKTAALLHDMGNPPFGHFGEKVVRTWFEKFFSSESTVKELIPEFQATMKNYKNIGGFLGEMSKDFEKCEGNAQLLRLVTKLCDFEPDYGLDLTYATLSLIIKYPSKALEIGKHKELGKSELECKKNGYYLSESKIFDEIQQKVKLNGRRHPLTYLLEAADDISYLISDLQDAYKKKLVSFENIIQELNILKRGNNYSKECEKLLEMIHEIKVATGADQNAIETLRDRMTCIRNIDYSEDGAEAILLKIINEINDAKNNDASKTDYVMTRLLSRLEEDLITAATFSFDENYDAIMEGKLPHELLKYDNSSKMVERLIRNLLEKYVYNNPDIIKSQISASTIISKLLNTFVPAVLNYDNFAKNIIDNQNDKLFLMLSSNYRDLCFKTIKEKAGSNPDEIVREKIYNLLLLVTDNVCGMTDSYAKHLYNIISVK